MLVDQLLFGYRDGHRQLAGSTVLDRTSASMLLDVTDTPVSTTRERLITGLPLQAARMYALAATWAAPELARPGAVWSHCLLIPFDTLLTTEELGVFAASLRRPDLDSQTAYGQQLSVHASMRPSEDSTPPSAELVAAIVSSSLATDRPRVVVDENLAVAETSLLTLWTASWPALRIALAFRTRETMRGAADDRFVSVTRRLRGLTKAPVRPHDVPSWAHALAEPSAAAHSTQHRFVDEFGPQEPPTLASLARLTELHALARIGRQASVV